MRFTTQIVSAVLLACVGSAAMAHDCSVSADPNASTSGYKLTRAQVMAETREAIRLGLVPQLPEIVEQRVATPEENEMIRQAGLRAIHKTETVASK